MNFTDSPYEYMMKQKPHVPQKYRNVDTIASQKEKDENSPYAERGKLRANLTRSCKDECRK